MLALKPVKLPCNRRVGYIENQLAYQVSCYKQFQVVPYQCRHCQLYHLLIIRE